MSSRRRAFTIIQLLVALSIFAVLVALATPAIKATRERAREHACMAHLHELAMKVREYRDEYNRYPLTLGELCEKGFADPSLLRCLEDPRFRDENKRKVLEAEKDTEMGKLFYGYDLFYAKRDPAESAEALLGGCAFHPGDRGLVVYVDGTVERAKFDRARLQSVSGPVEVRLREEVEWKPATAGMELRPGDAIRTGSGGQATILFFGEGSRLDLSENSLLIIKILLREPDTLGVKRLLALLSGSAWCEVDDSVYTGENDSFEVVTPSVVAGVRGTRFYVSVLNEALTGVDVDQDGALNTCLTYLQVEIGKVVARAKGKRFLLRKGARKLFKALIKRRKKKGGGR